MSLPPAPDTDSPLMAAWLKARVPVKQCDDKEEKKIIPKTPKAFVPLQTYDAEWASPGDALNAELDFMAPIGSGAIQYFPELSDDEDEIPEAAEVLLKVNNPAKEYAELMTERFKAQSEVGIDKKLVVVVSKVVKVKVEHNPEPEATETEEAEYVYFGMPADK